MQARQSQQLPEQSLEQPLRQANWCGIGWDSQNGDVEFTLAATGDSFPHENIQYVGETAGYDTLFDHIRPFLQASDLAYTNFDGAMLANSPISGYPNFNYNPALATALRDAGIALVSTANNHILDRGSEGLDATLRVLSEAGIQQHGTSITGTTAAPYLLIPLQRDGVTLRIGFISASWGTNGIPDPYNQVNLLFQSNDYGQQGGIRQSILDAVAQARRETDIVIVATHWGYEYQFYPDQTQIDGARALAAAGADLILGAQSHTLQPVDVIDTGSRRTLVIYSLANFIASQGAFQDSFYSATSVVFYVGMLRRADGSAAITGYRYLPTLMIDADTRPAPLPADDPATLAHVRLMMRDPGGIRQVSGDPGLLEERVEICPALRLPGSSELLRGDFAQLYQTLGGDSLRPVEDALRVFGMPLQPVKQGYRGDCSGLGDILLTEHARLELHPEADWPYRVVGSPLGVWALAQQHPELRPDVQTELRSQVFAQPAFEQFFYANGAVPVFGYPITSGIQEQSQGALRSIQYFERARFELDQNGGVILAALGRLFANTPLCPEIAPTSLPSGTDQQTAQPALPTLALATASLPANQPAPSATIARVAQAQAAPDISEGSAQSDSAVENRADLWVIWLGRLLPIGLVIELILIGSWLWQRQRR